VHVIGKDILKFHTVFWPALLMAADIEVPQHVFVHGYLLMGEHKMSKSLGNVIDPFQVIDMYGVDALRYYVLREVSFGQDGSVSPEGFEKRYDTELANEYGNLASRTTSMIAKFRDGTVPDADPPAALSSDFEGLVEHVCAQLDAVELSAALESIWQLVRRLNQYVQDEQPWRLARDDSAAEQLDAVLYGLAEGLRSVSLLLHPFMPEKTALVLAALGHEGRDLDGARFGAVGGGTRIGELEPLFPRIEQVTSAA
jgi:methionyl-tRNA synthetase